MTAGSVLGIEHSLAGRRWQARLTDERRAHAIAQQLGVPEIVGRVLAGRGIEPEDAERYLSPTLRELLPDPSRLQDMDAAVERLSRALRDGEAIAVFGDYDVDGATSSALLYRFFSTLGAPPRIHIPDRMTEGYGPNGAALEKLAAEGVRVVVTVDCGITAFDALSAGAAAGLDIIVVDHHKAEPRLPDACAVINPNRLDDDSGLGTLAAVGVAFMLVVALNRRLRDDGWYSAERPEPELRAWLDLVALGTVCDIVPLIGLNRAFVAQGLKVMARRANLGIAALADVAGMRERPGTFHLGFMLGPRVNAGGRVGDSGLGARLLVAAEAGEAAILAERLDSLNSDRQEVERSVLAAATAQLEAMPDGPGPVILAAGEGWHPGVIGIVASRLVNRYGRPACVVSLADGQAKGSGRSVLGFDLGAAVIAARQAGILANGGGHAMAAGFSLAAGDVAALGAFLAERYEQDPGDEDALRRLGLDGVLSVGAATRELLSVIEQAGPYGAGNAEPRFAFAGARIVRADVVGGKHLRVALADAGGARLQGIAFRALGTDLGDGLLKYAGRSLHVAGHLRLNAWQGREDVQLHIEDAATVEPAT